jgi:hypothetical protein
VSVQNVRRWIEQFTRLATAESASSLISEFWDADDDYYPVRKFPDGSLATAWSRSLRSSWSWEATREMRISAARSATPRSPSKAAVRKAAQEPERSAVAPWCRCAAGAS